MKRICAGMMALLLTLGVLCGCGAYTPQRHTQTWLDLFDTVTTVVKIGGPEEEFREQARQIYEQLRRYHRLLDIYNDYEGINNLKTVNDSAGIAPVTVDPEILALLSDCVDYYTLSGGKVNVALGSVLSLWHEARTDGLAAPEKATLPDPAALEEAAAHTDITGMILDEAASTVYLSDPLLRLDVGAVAKGWAVQKVAEAAPAGMLISVGGNVYATGPKDADGTPWIIGVQDPEGESYLHTMALAGGAVVTSGDYQRSYTVNGKAYHHIIDPATRMPAERWRSVTVVCEDSGLADALSTTLFLLPLEEGKAILAQCNAQALWVDASGRETMTEGFRALLQS